MTPLFNPRRQLWHRHFRWSAEGLLIVPRTIVGRATALALHLTRPELLNLRLALIAIGWHPPRETPRKPR
jgi:hypothetical protein